MVGMSESKQTQKKELKQQLIYWVHGIHQKAQLMKKEYAIFWNEKEQCLSVSYFEDMVKEPEGLCMVNGLWSSVEKKYPEKVVMDGDWSLYWMRLTGSKALPIGRWSIKLTNPAMVLEIQSINGVGLE